MIIIVAPIIALISSMMIITVVKLMPIHHKKSKSYDMTSPVITDRKQLHTFLKINSKSYSFTYRADRTGMQESAIDFCSNHGSSFGVTVKNFPNCIDTVVSALIHSENNSAAGSSSIITNDQMDPIIIDHDDSGPDDAIGQRYHTKAAHSTQAQTQNTPPTPISEERNLRPDQDDIQLQDLSPSSEKSNLSASIEISLEINGLTYVFDFPTANIDPKPAAFMLAQKFCSIHGSSLLGLTEADMGSETAITSKCAQPLSTALLSEATMTLNRHSA